MTTITLATDHGLRVLGDSSVDVLLDGADVIALHQLGDDLWLIADDHELVRVHDRVATSMAKLEAPGECVLADGDTVWIGTAAAHLYRFADGALEIVGAFDAAPSHADWYTPWGGPPATRSLAAGAGRIYANVHVGGILMSGDGGASWEPTLDLEVDVHQVNVDDAGAVWAATGERGLGLSRDRGRSWSFHDAGLHRTYLRCAVPAGDGVLVTASSGPFAHDGTVYRFDGERFTPCNGDLPARFEGNLNTGTLAAHGNTAALAAVDGKCYVSEDAGKTWTVAATDLPPVHAVAVS